MAFQNSFLSSLYNNEKLQTNSDVLSHQSFQTFCNQCIVVTEDFLVLDDITEGFELPTVMDIKVGKQTWGPDATEAKKAGEASKYVGTKGPYGFRLVFDRENFMPSLGLSINFVSFFGDFDPPPLNYISISYFPLKKCNTF